MPQTKVKIEGWKSIADKLGICVRTAKRWQPIIQLDGRNIIYQSFYKCKVWAYEHELNK